MRIIVIEKEGADGGISAEQAQHLLEKGWLCMPGVSLRVDAPTQIAQAGGLWKPSSMQQASPTVKLVDLWVEPPTMMIDPVAVVSSLVTAKREGFDPTTLDYMCRRILGVSLKELGERVERNAGATSEMGREE